MISVQEALDHVLAAARPLPFERVMVSQAGGRVLAQDVTSQRVLPPNDVSMRDGYAVRAADLAAAGADRPVRLRVMARSEAGHPAAIPIGEGEAARIMTGAAVPEGADAVVMQEQTRAEGAEVVVLTSAAPGGYVRPRGSEIRDGELAFARGSLLSPAAIAQLAELGRSVVQVHQRPRVALLATGDELCEIDEAPAGRIVDSNTWGLAAMVEAAGGIPVRQPVAADDRAGVVRAIEAAARCDVLVTSAGVSVGERDFVKEALADQGVTQVFWRVAIRPGKPIYFGTRGTQLVFGLPGNPTSGMVCFEQFVRPALLALQGRRQVVRPRVRARLERPVSKEKGFTSFVRASTRVEDGRLVTAPVDRQDSGLVSSMALANSLIVVEPERERVEAGEELFVLPLDGMLG